ncbi:MAG: hypothetical protein EZS28_013695 [Streblomastix strix]|uniref:Uncharacterized protein n=1 Tax=Streblomastix strix TaxID=222440 RepID=A0A5J4W7E6_9EUKA|nr:MAG: hypothetical protein EZS28_013695 [Streblomastix strix]
MQIRTETNNYILGMDMELEENEYKNARRKKVENVTNIEGLVQRNIQEQMRKDQTTSSVDRQVEFLQTLDKISVTVSTRIGQFKVTSFEEKIMVQDNDSKQNSNQRTEMMDKDNVSPQGWRAMLIYVIQIELIQHDYWSEKEVEMISNAKEIKAIHYRLLRFEQVFKKIQDQAVMIRSDNTTAVYDIWKWKAKESQIESIK